MHIFNFPVKFKLDKKEGGFLITFRDIPEAITQAETVEECFIEAADCLEEAIAGRIDDGFIVPEPSEKRRGEKIITVPSQSSVKR
jgi:antitoxin HicB